MEMIFDTHAHYDDAKFDADRDALLQSLPERGIGTVVNAAANKETTKKALALAARYPHVYATAGVHPSDCEELDEEEMDFLYQACEDRKCLAVGEIGLDYHWPEPERGLQQKWFRRQLQMALDKDLPVVIHSRDAAEDTLTIMKEAHAKGIRGDIHCFSYGREMAREYLNMGFYLGIGGVVTFKNGRKMKEVVAYAPIDQLLLETDAPYLAPEPHRGSRNSSLNLPIVVKTIAEIKGMEEEEVIRITEENARKMYGLDS